MRAETKNGIATFYATSRMEWRNWLEKNGAKERSVWLIIYKKESRVPSVYYREAVDEALCFGWIDSKPNERDGESYYQFFSKRNPKSKWSKVNKEKVERLMKQGLMHEAGIAAVEIAKQNGAWTALDEIEELVIPTDLESALKQHKDAMKYFNEFPKSVKRGILEWISNAKREETRAKRIEETASLAGKNIRANQYRQ